MTLFHGKAYYQDDWCTIYHGDCRDILPHLEKVDLVLTDPPYGIDYSSDYICDTTTARWMGQAIANDGTTDLRDWLIGQLSCDWVCFGSHRAPPPDEYRGLLIWDKGPASGMGDLSFPWKASFEFIFVKGSGFAGFRDEGVIKGSHIVTRASMGRSHPNEKPISLIRRLIEKHPGETILDPFMGSGTTLVAAKNLNRKSIGIEIEEKYCEIAAKRLSQEVFNFGASA